MTALRLVACCLLAITGCAASTDHPAPGAGGGGKADGDSPDGGTAPDGPAPDAAPMLALMGTCTVTTTTYYDNYGTPESTMEPIALQLHVDSVAADGTATGTVHVASPWQQIPDGLWRGWCHLAHLDGQPLDQACAIGPYDIGTAALGFHAGYSYFKQEQGGYTLSLGAHLELDRDSYFDPNWTKVSYSCSLH